MIVKPSDLKIETISEKGNTGVFTIEPLPTGFGHTLGNSLRRVLLTSIKGAAITQLRLDGAKHQFSTIDGVKEDAVELGLNLKKLRFRSYSDNPVIATIEVTGPAVVTAKDIECPADLEVMNKDQHIATLADKKTKFKAEITVETGYGYSPTEERENSKVGVIMLDALYSPVLSATYEVEDARFGAATDLDKLVLTVETDGSITSKDSVVNAAELLRDFFERIGTWTVTSAPEEEITSVDDEDNETESILVDELPLPTRTVNALKKAGIDTLQDLAQKADEELSDIKNLGEKSVEEIRKLLKKEGFR